MTTYRTYTPAMIAAALAGKVAAWHMIVTAAKETGDIDTVAKDARAELDRLPIATNSRKGGGKTLSNIVSLIRRAEANKVPLHDGDKLRSMGAIEKDCKAAEAPPETVAPAAAGEGEGEGAAAGEGEATGQTTAAPEAVAEALRQELALVMAERDNLARKLQAVAEAKSMKEVRAILAA